MSVIKLEFREEKKKPIIFEDVINFWLDGIWINIVHFVKEKSFFNDVRYHVEDIFSITEEYDRK